MRTVVGLAVLLLVGGAAPAAEAEPLLSLRCESLDRLGEVGESVFGAAGANREWKSLLEKLGQLVPSLAGVDRGKPLGLCALRQGKATPLLLVVPLADSKEFLKRTGAEERRGAASDPCVYQFQPGGGKLTVSLRLEHDHAYLSLEGPDALLVGSLPRPEKALLGEGLLSLRLNLAEMPGDLRLSLIRPGKEFLKSLGERRPDDSQAGLGFRLQLAEVLRGWLDRVESEGKTVTAAATVEGRGGVGLQLTLTGQDQSKLAQAIEAAGKQQSLFAGLKDDETALAARGTLTPGKEMLTALLALGQEAMGEGGKEQTALLALLQPTIETGVADVVYQVRGPGPKETYTLLAGLAVKKGDDIDKKLKAMARRSETVAKLFKAEDGTPKGTTIYRVSVAEKPKSLAAMGDHPIFLAVRDDLLAVTAGAEGRKALDELLALKPAPGPVTAIRLSPGRLAALRGIKGESPRGGGLQLTVEGGARLRLGLRTDLESLRLLAEAAR